MKIIAKRLIDGMDLKKEIQKIAEEQNIDPVRSRSPQGDHSTDVLVGAASNGIEAGVLLSAVGSLGVATLRMAAAIETKKWNGPLEIVSATGTISKHGLHIHLSVSDEEGNVFGGHLKDGCMIRTTVELVIGIIPDVKFKRELDPKTGFKELIIE